MKYFRNAVTGELIGYDEEKNSVSVFEPVDFASQEEIQKKVEKVLGEPIVTEPRKKRKYTKRGQVPLARSARMAPVSSTKPVVSSEGFLLSQHDFEFIKEMQNEDSTSLQVQSEAPHIPLQIINWAFQAPTYKDYQRIAKAI